MLSVILPQMIGNRVKTLREAKCWSQAHLAEAAGLNIRTVQRIEAGGASAPETMLSLAAALDVDVAELGDRPRPQPRGARLAIAGVLVLPAASFVMVNLLRSLAGIAGPYDLLEAAGSRVMDFRTFNLVSPVFFIGGAAAGIALTLPMLVRFRTKIDRGMLVVSGVELTSRRVALLVTAIAILSAATLLIYAAAEQLRTPII